MTVCKLHPFVCKYIYSQTYTHVIWVLWGAHFLMEQYDPPATFLQFSFLPVSDHLMFRWQQKPSPTSKGSNRSFWFLGIILQQGRVEHWAASQILYQWPRDSLENYNFVNPRSYSSHLENFLFFPKKSSSHKIQRAILQKRLWTGSSSQIQKLNFVI